MRRPFCVETSFFTFLIATNSALSGALPAHVTCLDVAGASRQLGNLDLNKRVMPTHR
ncbi:MAG: hypothetical protein ACREDM_10990 [Methylocella sp.]